MIITFISASKNHSQTYHRCTEPARWMNQYFQASGGDDIAYVLTAKDFEDNYASSIAHVDRSDVLVFHTTHEPFVMLMKHYKGKKKIVCDFDDAEDLFVNEQYLGLTKWIQGWDMFAIEMMEVADIITCTTNLLASHIQAVSQRDAIVISNAIDYTLPMWTMEKTPYTDSYNIGYIGGQYSVPVLMHYLPSMLNTNGLDVAFHYCGIMTEKLCNTKRGNIYIHENLSFQRYGSFYAGLDCVFVHIKSDEIGKHKSQLKLLEAAAYNLNVICEDKEPYTHYIKEAPDTFIAIQSPSNLHDAIAEAKKKTPHTRKWADTRFHINDINLQRIKIYME